MSDEEATAAGAAYLQRYTPPPPPPVEGAPEVAPQAAPTDADALEVGRKLELRYLTPEEIKDEYPDGIPESLLAPLPSGPKPVPPA
jgi:hypothetical protein